MPERSALHKEDAEATIGLRGAGPSEQVRRRGRKPKADAKSAQINIRMDPQLKAAGDVVLERLGTSCSDAVRALYRYVVREQALPEGLEQVGEGAQESWSEGAGLAWKLYSDLEGGSKTRRKVPTAPLPGDVGGESQKGGHDAMMACMHSEQYQRYLCLDRGSSKGGPR